MGDFERTATVTVSPEDAFRFLADPGNLPQYIATMSLARPEEGGRLRVAAEVQGRHEEGEAWFRVDPSQRRLEWGAEGQGEYGGWLLVSQSGEGAAVTIHVHTQHDDEKAEVDRALDATVSNIEHLLGTG